MRKVIHFNRIAKNKRLERDKNLQNLKIPDPNTYLTQEKIEKYLNAPVYKLKEYLESKEVTSVQLLNLFAYRCKTIGHKLELITEIDYENAM